MSTNELLRRALEFIPENPDPRRGHSRNGLASYPSYTTEAERLRHEANRAAERLERGEALRQEIIAALKEA